MRPYDVTMIAVRSTSPFLLQIQFLILFQRKLLTIMLDTKYSIIRLRLYADSASLPLFHGAIRKKNQKLVNRENFFVN